MSSTTHRSPRNTNPRHQPATRPFHLRQAKPTTRAMLEVLADGAEHPTEAVLLAGTRAAEVEGRAPHEIRRVYTRRIKDGAPEPDVTDPNLIRAACRGIAQNSLKLLQGRGRVITTTNRAGLSMTIAAPDVIAAWDEEHATAGTKRPSRPEVLFGGMTEDDGWACAPLQLQDQIHFRSADNLPLKRILRAMPAHVDLRQDPDGLYRGTCKAGTGDEVVALLKAWCAKRHLHQSDMRPEPNKWRRDLRDLPEDWLNDLCKHYQPAARQIIASRQSQIRVHVPDPEDVNCLVNSWILEAVTRYDPDLTTDGGARVPFSGYMRTVLKKEAADLARKAHGRKAADLELHLSRAISRFEQEHARRPSDEELAQMLNLTVDQVRTRQLEVFTLRNMRNQAPLDVGPDEPDIPLPVESTAEDHLVDEAERAMLTFALVHGCAYTAPILPSPVTDGENHTESCPPDLRVGDHNPVAFASLHMEEALNLSRADVARMYGYTEEQVEQARAAALPRIQDLIRYQNR